MVGIVEGVLIACALALDVYAYKKMKDAEMLAENVRTTSTATAITVQKEAKKESTETAAPKEEWNPNITYETHFDQTGDELRMLREELKTDFQNLNERVDVMDERAKENHSALEAKIEAVNSRIENPEIEIPEEKLAEILGRDVTGRLKSLGKKLDNQGDKLLQLENKMDTCIIGAPDTMLIKKDLREEFAPLYRVEKKVDELTEKMTKRINKVEKKANTARNRAEENESKLKTLAKKEAKKEPKREAKKKE